LKKNEIEIVKSFLTNLLITEENQYFKDDEEKEFYLAHKIPMKTYIFTFYDEPLYIIFQIDDWCIYYNDIEESFGISKIVDNKCYESIEFSDNLAPTVRKFKEAYEKKNMEWLFE